MVSKVAIQILLTLMISGCSRDLASAKIDRDGEVDFEMHHNIIIVEAFVNNKWSKFIIDTGASVSLLDFNQSRKYNFTYSIDVDNRLTGFGGSSKLMKTSKVLFAMKGVLSNRSFQFSASDLSSLNTILSHSQQRVLGILGNDFLESHGAIIDYQRKKILIASLN